MCDSLSEQQPSAAPVSGRQGTGPRSLVLYNRRDNCYWREGPIAAHGSLGSIPISVDLVFTGGHFDGVRQPKELLIIFVREDGVVFKCQYGSHDPRLVVSIMPRGLVRLRLFASGFYWIRCRTLSSEGLGANVGIGVVDDEGREHHFNFWVDGIRGLFPAVLTEVT